MVEKQRNVHQWLYVGYTLIFIGIVFAVVFYRLWRGNQIVFVLAEGEHSSAPYRIATMDADGTNNQQLTGEYMDSYPVWSPDGEYIAFQSVRDDPDNHFDIYVMRKDGTDIRCLTFHPAHDRRLSWSPDGKRIVFESNRDSGSSSIVQGNSPIWRP